MMQQALYTPESMAARAKYLQKQGLERRAVSLWQHVITHPGASDELRAEACDACGVIQIAEGASTVKAAPKSDTAAAVTLPTLQRVIAEKMPGAFITPQIREQFLNDMKHKHTPARAIRFKPAKTKNAAPAAPTERSKPGRKPMPDEQRAVVIRARYDKANARRREQRAIELATGIKPEVSPEVAARRKAAADARNAKRREARRLYRESHPSKRGQSPEVRRVVYDALQAGHSQEKIAAMIGKSRMVVRKLAKEFKEGVKVEVMNG